jgi:hypothetical protein
LTIILFGIKKKSKKKKKKKYMRNLIILLTKFYIYRTQLNTEQVHLKALQDHLKENLVIEKNIYYKNKSYEKANTCWIYYKKKNVYCISYSWINDAINCLLDVYFLIFVYDNK